MKSDIRSLEITLSDHLNERPSSLLSLEVKDIDSFVCDLREEPIRLEEKKIGRRKSKKGKHITYIKKCNSNEDILSCLYKNQKEQERKHGYSYLCLAFPFLKIDSVEQPLLFLPIDLIKIQSDYFIQSKWDYSIHQNQIFSLENIKIPEYDKSKSLKEYLSALNYLFKSEPKIHLEQEVEVLEFDLDSWILEKHLEQISATEKEQYLQRFIPSDKKTPSNQQTFFHIRDCGEKEEECIKSLNLGNSFSVSFAPGYKKEDIELNLTADALIHNNKVLVVSSNREELERFKNAWETTKTNDLTLSLFNRESTKRELAISKNCFDKKYVNPVEKNTIDKTSKEKLDDYACSFYKKDKDFNKSPSELYPELLGLSNMPLLTDCEFDILDFKGIKYEYALNNIRFIQNDLQSFTKDYKSHVYYGLLINDKASFQSFQKTIFKCKRNIDTIRAVISTIFPEKKLSDFNINQIKNIFDFLKKFYSLSIVEPLFFQATKRKNLVLKLNELLPMIAIEENLIRNILRIAKPEILKLNNLQYIKDRFDNKYQRVFSLFSSGYRKDMQMLNQYALSPLSKDEAFELVSLLENYNVNHKKISLFLAKLKKQLSESTNLTENNCGKFVEENLFYEHIKGDIDFLKDKPLNGVLTFKKNLPIRNINSVDFSCSLEIFYDKNIIQLKSMNLLEYSDFITKSIQELDNLPKFLTFLRRIELAKKDNYGSFLDSYLKKDFEEITLLDCFKKKYLTSLQDYFYKKHPILGEMSEKEYEKTLADFEKKTNEEEKSNLVYLKNQLNQIRYTEIENFPPMEAKRIFRKSNDVLDYIENHFQLLQIVFPLHIMTISQATRLLPEKGEYDLILLLDQGNSTILEIIPLLAKCKQMIILRDICLYNSNPASLACISDENNIILNHSEIDEDILDFSNRQFFASSLISYPYFNKNAINIRSFTYTEKTDPKLIEHEILLELENEKKENPKEAISILTLWENQRDNLSKETKEEVVCLNDFKGQRKHVIISLYEAFEEKEGNPFYQDNGKNNLIKLLTSAEKRLTILYFKKINSQTNQNGLPPCLKILKEYLYTSRKNFSILERKDKLQFEKIKSFLLEKGYEMLPDSTYRNAFDFILIKDNVPFAVLDFYNSKLESIDNTFERDLKRKKVVEERGLHYLRILPSCFSNEERASLSWLNNSLKKTEKLLTKRTLH